MKLTREQAIKEHRKMWRWIAEETENRRYCVSKTKYYIGKTVFLTQQEAEAALEKERS